MIKWLVSRINQGKELAKLRATRQLELEDRMVAWAAELLDTLNVCPKCWTKDGVVGKYHRHHCTHEWHGAEVRHQGTYNGLTRRQALLQFAQKYYEFRD